MNTADRHARITALVTPFGIGVKPGRSGGVAVLRYVTGVASDRAGARDALRAEAARLRGLGLGVDAQSFELAGAIVGPPRHWTPSIATGA